jgi:hypothetical protein
MWAARKRDVDDHRKVSAPGKRERRERVCEAERAGSNPRVFVSEG